MTEITILNCSDILSICVADDDEASIWLLCSSRRLPAADAPRADDQRSMPAPAQSTSTAPTDNPWTDLLRKLSGGR